MNLHWLWAAWIAGGLLLVGLEMLAPGVFLIWVGLAAIATGCAAAFLPLGEMAQVGLFVALALALVGLVGLRMRRSPGVDRVNAPAAGLVGQTCRALAFEGAEGRVSLGDGTWLARAADGVRPAAGQALRVVGLDGTVLLVSSRLKEY